MRDSDRDDQTVSLERTDCLLCGQDDPEVMLNARDWLHGQPGEFRVVRCRQCKMVYLNPRPTRESIGKYYPSDYVYAPPANTLGRSKSLRSKFIQKILARYYGYPIDAPALPKGLGIFLPLLHELYKTVALPILPWQPNGWILDVGCGKGDYLAGLREFGWKCVGLEINPNAVQYAHDILKLDIIERDIENARLPSHSFDAITMWWYLEHVANPISVLKEARRLIKPGGTLLIGVPNWDGLEAKIFRRAWYHLDAPRHFSLFTPATLTATLRRAGFQNVTLSGYSWLNDPAESIERWLDFTFNGRHTFPRAVRFMLAPAGWLAARIQRGSVMIASAKA